MAKTKALISCVVTVGFLMRGYNFDSKTVDCKYWLEPPCLGVSNVYPQSLC